MKERPIVEDQVFHVTEENFDEMYEYFRKVYLLRGKVTFEKQELFYKMMEGIPVICNVSKNG